MQQGPQDPEAGHPRDASEEEGACRGEEVAGDQGEVGGGGIPEAAGAASQGAEGAPLRVAGQETLLLQAVAGTKEDVRRRVDVCCCHIFFRDGRGSSVWVMVGRVGNRRTLSPWITPALALSGPALTHCIC